MSHVCCLNTYGSAMHVAFPAAWKVDKGIPECNRPVSLLSVTLRCVSLSDAKHLQCRYACCFVGRSRTGDNAVSNWRSADSSRPAGTAGRPLCPASSHTHSGAIQLRLSFCVCFCCEGNCHAEQKACTLVRRILPSKHKPGLKQIQLQYSLGFGFLGSLLHHNVPPGLCQNCL